MDLSEMLAKLQAAMGGDEDDDKRYQHWQQLGTLTDEDNRLLRAHQARSNEAALEIMVLLKKASILKAQIDLGHDEFWARLKKSHGIPVNGNFHLCDDGRILMEPKAKKGRTKTEKKENGNG